MTHLLTQFASEESASGLGALGVDGKAFLIQLITFLLAFWVLKRFAFKPIIKVLNERYDLIESGVTLGEKMRKDEAKMDERVASELAKARKEADGILAAANETSRDKIHDAEEKARAKGEAMIREAEERIKTESARERKKLEKEIVSLVSDATEAIIGEKVDAKKDAQLIERALGERQ